jgi:hypothetical protein
MPFVIRFLPDESVTVGGVVFTVHLDPPRLERAGHPPTPVTDTPHSLLPEVTVALSARQTPPYLGVAFQAPRDVLILRGVRADVL